jgi:hypothetical protein
LANKSSGPYIRQITNEITSIKTDASSSFSFTRISMLSRNWWRRTARIVQLVGVYSRIIMQYCMCRIENYMGCGSGDGDIIILFDSSQPVARFAASSLSSFFFDASNMKKVN